MEEIHSSLKYCQECKKTVYDEEHDCEQSWELRTYNEDTKTWTKWERHWAEYESDAWAEWLTKIDGWETLKNKLIEMRKYNTKEIWNAPIIS